MNNIFTIKYNNDGSIAAMDNVKLFKFSNGVTTVRALCPFEPSKYDAYINFVLPNDEQLSSRVMQPKSEQIGGMYAYDYLMQAQELQYRGPLKMSVTFEERI